MNFENNIIDSMDKYLDNNSVDKWKKVYINKIKNIYHDEPWLTLVSLFSIFNDQNHFQKNQINSIQSVFDQSGFGKDIVVDSIEEVSIERILPEIKIYRAYLYNLLSSDDIHLYPDKNNILRERSDNYIKTNGNKQSSLEGNTNLDAQIIFKENGRKKYMFIEAKFLSDIATKTTYNPVRNQIIRNIDAMIDFVFIEKENGVEIALDDVYFSLLTPKVFRRNKYGSNKSSGLGVFNPQNSRLYCYLMDEYKNYQALKEDLPHRDLADKQWETISKQLGWMTFDDLYLAAKVNHTIKSNNKDFEEFFRARNLY